MTANAYQPSQPPGLSAFAVVVDTTASGSSSLVYSTYLGGTGGNSSATAVAVDSFGKFYLTGLTTPGFPTTAGAFQPSHAGCSYNYPGGSQFGSCYDVFVAKLDPSASGAQSLIYSTYIGGTGDDGGYGIAVDDSGNTYVTGTVFGYTNSDFGTFPVTSGAYNTTYGAGIFVAKVNSGGSKLVYSTYLSPEGGASAGIAVDAFGSAYVTGSTGLSTFPVTPDAFQPTYLGGGGQSDAFLTKFIADGSGLIYSTFLGGHGQDDATAIALDQVGDVYVTGWTGSSDFPVTSFVFQPALNPGKSDCDGCFAADAFLTKFPLSSSAALTVTSIVPSGGGNTGTVTAKIFGTGFHAGATVNLACGAANVVGTNPTRTGESR